MRFRQPDVERDQPGLHAEPEEEQDEQRRRGAGPARSVPDSRAGNARIPAAAAAPETGDQAAGADVRHHEIQVRGAAVARDSCSVATSAAVASDISSQANRNVTTLSAAKTVSSAPAAR